jgi:uncharacterized damage-inducible protein DinB
MLERMIEQMHWANALSLEWLAGDRKEKAQHMRLLGHVLNAESVWLQRIHGALKDKTAFTDRTLDEMAAMNDANRRDFLALAASDVSRVIDYNLFNGDAARSSVLDIFLHVWSHGFHHRGQMSALASRAGEQFPNVAHIQFSRVVK